MKKIANGEKGFTIIEVVLVLAIAGLIFMVVFLALPGLQANQRDTQRRQVLSDAVAAMVTYQSNHKGNLPYGVGRTGAPADTPSIPGITSSGGSGGTATITRPTVQQVLNSPASFAEPRTNAQYFIEEVTRSTMTSLTAAGANDNVIYFARATSGDYPQCDDDTGTISYATDKVKNTFVMTLVLDSGTQMYCQAS